MASVEHRRRSRTDQPDPGPEGQARRSASHRGSLRDEPSRSLADKAVLVLLGTVVALVPFPFGSTEPFIVAIWCAVLGAALCLSVFVHVGRGPGRVLLLVFAVSSCLAAVACFQLTDGLGLVDPDPIWAKASTLLKTPLTPTISVVRWQPFYAAGPALAFVSSLSLAIMVGNTRVGARQLFKIIGWSGLAYAVYGILGAILTPTSVLWVDRSGYTGNALGTFLIRNTAASYFGMITLVWTGFACDAIRKVLPAGTFTWRRLNDKVLSRPDRAILMPAVAAFLCFMALFMSGSRAGAIISLLALSGVILAMFWADLPRTGLRARAIGGTVVVLLIILQIVGGGISNRFNMSGLDDEGRFAIQAATLQIATEHPWFGTGLGTFPWIFPSYRRIPPDMSNIIDHAFSTPVEMTAELGFPMVGVIAAAMMVVLVGMALRLRHAGDRRSTVLTGLAVALVALVHSLIDYPLQIPGFAVVAAAVVGGAVGQAFGLPLRPRPDHKASERHRDSDRSRREDFPPAQQTP